MGKKVLVIGATFPSKHLVAEGVYLYNLMRFFKNSFNIQIFVPNKAFGKKNIYVEFEDFSTIVSRPKYLNLEKLSTYLKVKPLSSYIQEFSRKTYYKAIMKEAPTDIDVIYSHFLFPSGYAAYNISKIINKPYFVALGESTFDNYLSSGGVKALRNADGLVVVSQKIKDFLINNVDIDDSKILVAPNRADSNIFKPMNRDECRKQLGFDQDERILIFVGQFILRKGYDRVLKAIDNLPFKVSCIFIGKGEIPQESSHIIYKGMVENKQLPAFYNAADGFILPTISEGSCNAIAEAISCGLPIISSDITEIKEQIFLNSSILVDPADPVAIAKGIEFFYGNIAEYQQKSLANSKKYSLEARAKDIITFIEKHS